MLASLYVGSREVIREDIEYIKNPYTNKKISSFVKCNAQDVNDCLRVAKDAFIHTKQSPLHQRISWLEDVVVSLQKQKEDIARTLCDEVCKPITFARIEVDRCIETIKLSCSAMIHTHGQTINTDASPSGKKTNSFYIREPVGVISCITPFNFPLNLVAHKIAPAIVSGNCVILKPTPQAPLSAYKLVKLFIDSKYAIKDAISIVYGDIEVGNAMVTSPIPRVISFTGSVQVGEIIAKNAGIKKLNLELGGNASTYIDKSADICIAAKRCAFGSFINSGQVCISLQRIYVHEDIYEEFSQKLQKETSMLKIGNPYEENTFLSSLINKHSLDRIKLWIQSAIDEGAKCILGNKSDGLNFYPTIMTEVKNTMKIVSEEAFAPIVSLIPVNTYTDAMKEINNSKFALQFSIFTNNLKQSQDFINNASCAGVVINDIPTLRFDIQPFGGNKLSGIGKEGPSFAIEEFTQIKSIVIC
jgi:acyl-CoA reductase-like NAD-dependent aldehyde dehydrogenase